MKYEEAICDVQTLIERAVGINNEDDPMWETYWCLADGYDAAVECIRELLEYCNNPAAAEKAWKLLDKLEGKS